MNREWTTILEYEIEGGCGRKVKGGGWGVGFVRNLKLKTWTLVWKGV